MAALREVCVGDIIEQQLSESVAWSRHNVAWRKLQACGQPYGAENNLRWWRPPVGSYSAAVSHTAVGRVKQERM